MRLFRQLLRTSYHALTTRSARISALFVKQAKFLRFLIGKACQLSDSRLKASSMRKKLFAAAAVRTFSRARTSRP